MAENKEIEIEVKEEPKVFVDGLSMTPEAFQKLQESDKSKRYVESEKKGHYRSLSGIRG